MILPEILLGERKGCKMEQKRPYGMIYKAFCAFWLGFYHQERMETKEPVGACKCYKNGDFEAKKHQVEKMNKNSIKNGAKAL